jgi:hypothetical protein
MSTYRINEATFELPDGWPDQTINIFPNSREDTAQCSLVMSRDQTQAGETLVDYVARQHKLLYEQLPQLHMLRRDDSTVDGLAAMEAEFTWQSETGLMRQRQVYLVRDGKALTLTATSLDRDFSHYASVVDDIIASFHFLS